MLITQTQQESLLNNWKDSKNSSLKAKNQRKQLSYLKGKTCRFGIRDGKMYLASSSSVSGVQQVSPCCAIILTTFDFNDDSYAYVDDDLEEVEEKPIIEE